MGHLIHIFFAVLAVASPAWATSWTFSLDAQCTTINCNSSGTPITGVFTATESVSGATFNNGTYTRPAPGFLKLTIPAGASAGTGSWKSSLPFSVAAIQAPGVGIISDTMLAGETQPIVMVDSPTCGSGNFSGNFLAGQWSGNDMTSSSQMATGYLSWTNASNAFTINSLYNVTAGTNVLGSSFTMNGSSCNSGMYTFVGSGDRGGTAWLGSRNSIIYSSNVGHTFYGLPDNSIPSTNSLYGTYAALRYDSYAGASTPIMPMYVSINTAGSTATSQAYSDPFTGTIATGGAALTETMTISSINSPRQGMLTGTMAGSYNGKIQCAVGLNLDDGTVTKNILFCAGQSPSDSASRSPYNLFMVSVKDYPGGLNKAWNSTGIVKTDLANVSGNGAFSVAQDDLGRWVVGTSYNYTAKVYRYDTGSALDTTFNSTGIVQLGSSAMGKVYVALQTDHKIVATYVHSLWSETTGQDIVVTRLRTDGSLDTTFGTAGFTVTDFSSGANDAPAAIALQTDGKIVVVGSGSSPIQGIVLRYLTTGALDTTFGTSGYVVQDIDSGTERFAAVAIQTDGKIVAVGSSTNTSLIMARYLTNGSLDTTFGASGGYSKLSTLAGGGRGVTLQTDGKILIVGRDPVSYGVAACRMTSAGVLDTTFNAGGIAKLSVVSGTSDTGNAIALQPDEKILVAGATFDGSYLNYTLARFLPSGALDTTFNGNGKSSTQVSSQTNVARALTINSDGTITVVGDTYNGTTYGQGIVKYWP